MTPEQTQVRRSSYLHFEGMAWPNPDDPNEVKYALRYGTPTREQLLVAASHMAAYRQLVDLPVRTRNQRVASIRASLSPTDEQR